MKVCFECFLNKRILAMASVLASALLVGCGDGDKDVRKELYSNGNVKVEASYDGNTLHGKYIEYYESGKKKAVGSYKYGQKDGKWEYYCNGNSDQICKEQNFSGGHLEGFEKFWYDNGLQKSESVYSNKRKNGKTRWWFKNGQLSLEADYKDGVFVDGYYRRLSQKGELMIEEHLENNSPVGLWFEYDGEGARVDMGFEKRGKLLKEALFKDGKGVGVWKMWSRLQEKLVEINCDEANCDLAFYREAGSYSEKPDTFSSRSNAASVQNSKTKSKPAKKKN